MKAPRALKPLADAAYCTYLLLLWLIVFIKLIIRDQTSPQLENKVSLLCLLSDDSKKSFILIFIERILYKVVQNS